LAFALQHIIAYKKPQPMQSLNSSDHFAPNKSGKGAVSGPYGYLEIVL
jgi:hypothetical protein